MSEVVKLPRKPRPLKKVYFPGAPYVVQRVDDEELAGICYEVIDERPESYRIVCHCDDDEGRNPYAKHDAEQIAKALNMMVQMNKERLPQVKESEE